MLQVTKIMKKKHFCQKNFFHKINLRTRLNPTLTSNAETCQKKTKNFSLNVQKEKKTSFKVTISPQSVSLDTWNGVLTSRSNIFPSRSKNIEQLVLTEIVQWIGRKQFRQVDRNIFDESSKNKQNDLFLKIFFSSNRSQGHVE